MEGEPRVRREKSLELDLESEVIWILFEKKNTDMDNLLRRIKMKRTKHCFDSPYMFLLQAVQTASKSKQHILGGSLLMDLGTQRFDSHNFAE